MPLWFSVLVTAVPTVLTAYVLYRSKNAEVIKTEMEAWKGKAERLAEENGMLITTSHDKDVQIADLKARTDLSEIQKGQKAIMGLIATQNASLVQMTVTLEKMEQRLDRGLIMR